jgi:hypothetical protein
MQAFSLRPTVGWLKSLSGSCGERQRRKIIDNEAVVALVFAIL